MCFIEKNAQEVLFHLDAGVRGSVLLGHQKNQRVNKVLVDGDRSILLVL